MYCQIEEKETINIKEWNDYTICHSGNPTQLYEYGNLYCGNSSPIYLTIYDNSLKVLQWLLCCHKKSILCFVSAESEPSYENEKYITHAIDYICQIYKPFMFNFYSISLSRFQDIDLLSSLKFDSIFEYESNQIDLTLSDDELFKDIHSKHRNVIRKAEKSNVHIFEGYSKNDLEKYYQLSQETYKRSNGKNFTYQALIKYVENLKKTGNIRIFFAEADNKIQAAAIILITSKLAIYWHGASCNNTSAGISNYLHWQIIKKLKEEFVEKYDFGGLSINPDKGSKSEGINRFKKRFGGIVGKYYGGIMLRNKLIYEIFNLYNLAKKELVNLLLFIKR